MDDAEVQHRLAVVEEQIGDPQKALKAHQSCLRLAPNNPLAYLYTGYCLQQQGQLEEAVRVYSLGSDLDTHFLAPRPGDSPTDLRYAAASRALRGHFTSLHRSAVGKDITDRRIHNAIWTRTHDQPFEFEQDGQIPQLFYIPTLKPAPYFESEIWPWTKSLEQSAAVILEEFSAANHVVNDQGRPYLSSDMALDDALAPLAGSLNWTALDLFRDGQANAQVGEHFPRTLAALSQVPLYGLNELPFEAFFSVLKPGQHITPHYGLSNHSLTVHLPLITPQPGYLTVSGEARPWEFGKLIAFDDSYLHEAHNQSDSERVVLIFSIWHPDLSESERLAIQRSFNARVQWLQSR
ncbi:aspartyl/asparaginyl beta-hydroxylase domain-containing protein [Marinobacter alexandrii]|uniref:aspartyl/asparaginyl beta-hydroxylase domain-containing protein n=1 Tax=Marinobacter alexandrii TaxID=2570351 RepID=UPI003299D77F